MALAERCVDEDGADVIVLAGAPLAGLARALRGRLPVPVVDGVSSAVRHAETLVALQPGRAHARQLRAAAGQGRTAACPMHVEALLRQPTTISTARHSRTTHFADPRRPHVSRLHRLQPLSRLAPALPLRRRRRRSA